MEDYFDAKARLFDPGSPTHAAASVVCIDDDAGRAMAALAHDPVTVSATGRDADWRVEDVAHGRARRPGVRRRRSRRACTTGCGSGCPAATTSPTACWRSALLDAVGVSPEQAAPGLRDARVPGRLEPIDRGQDFLALVDYAHKPGALRAVLETLRAQSDRPRRGGVRRGRQPRPGQARADGPGRRRAGRPGGGHRRQPARRGSRRDPGGDRGRCDRGGHRGAGRRDRRPARGHRPRRRRGPAPGTSC